LSVSTDRPTCPRCKRDFDADVHFCPFDGVALEAPPQTDPWIGKILDGQYEITAIAGQGATGTVYRARQRGIERHVAIKVLRGELACDEVSVRRFLREARASARLEHPGIVAVHAIGKTPAGAPYIAMELVEGRSLEEVCAAEGPLATRRTIGLARQLAAALDEAHRAGIVHRDLKPANVMVREREPLQVKILDFGIARLQPGGEDGSSKVSADGAICGTPHYMAPEQATGGEIDGRTDVYSMGVLMYRMLSGTVPFDGTSGMQVLLAHLKQQPPSLHARVPELDEELEAVVSECLAKDRNARPRSAAELERRLARIEARLASESETMTEEVEAVAKRRPSRWIAGGIMLVTGVAIGALLTLQPGAPVAPPLQRAIAAATVTKALPVVTTPLAPERIVVHTREVPIQRHARRGSAHHLQPPTIDIQRPAPSSAPAEQHSEEHAAITPPAAPFNDPTTLPPPRPDDI
jgi:serine/threonine-protein kinase